MPTYEYQCRKCGHRFEALQKVSDPPLTHCPSNECIQADEEKGTGDVVRLISGGAGLVFKGQGFYLTDYARKSGKSGGGDTGSKGD